MNRKSFTNLLRVLGVFVLVSIVWHLTSVHAGVPKLINFEGKLTEIDGTPISGKKTITFRIYDSETGPIPPIWMETREVVIDNGFYSILLGSVNGFPSSMKFDTTYWLSVQVSGEDEMTPRYQIGAVPYAINADMVDGKDSTEIIPRGVIVMWSGTLATIPNGWHICDGTNETPDLRDRFILGVASSSENPGATGGSHSVTLTTANLPVHTHSGTTDTSGAHRHNVEVRSSGEAGTRVMSTYSGWPLSGYQETESAGAHTHSFTTGSTGSGTAFDNRPAYYKLAYIMKL